MIDPTPFDPDAIRARVRTAFELAGEAPWLIGYDINEIQQLVTASSRPVAMRGASQAIKGFDARCQKLPRTIFAGGGRGVELAASEAAAHARIQELVSEFRAKTHGGVLAAAAVPFRRDDQRLSLAWLKRRLDNAKDAAPRTGGQLADDKDHQCKDCNAFHAEHRVDSGDEERHVCARCHLLINAGRSAGRDTNEASKSLLEFASDRRIAAISADGNNLGAFFASLDSLEELAAASEVITKIFREAHVAALRRIAPLKALSPVTGGDDLRVFVAPAGVLLYVEALVRGVEDGAKRAGDLGGILPVVRAQALARIGVGVGAVVAGHHYPAARLMACAHDMERSAKKICRSGSGSRSAFDFAILDSDSAVAEEARQPAISMDEPGWTSTRRSIEALRRQLPTSQRAVLAEQRNLSTEEFENLLCYQVARSRHWQAWFQDCNVNWTDRVELCKHVSGTRVELLELLAPEGHS